MNESDSKEQDEETINEDHSLSISQIPDDIANEICEMIELE